VWTETPNTTVDQLSASASIAPCTLVIGVVNPRADADVELECVLRGASARAASAQLLHGTDWKAYNNFEQPDHVFPNGIQWP
jgi:alpha-L-arabinofuranosidase